MTGPRILRIKTKMNSGEVVGILLPWHVLLARLLAHDPNMKEVEVGQLRSQTVGTLERRCKTHDRIPYAVAKIEFEVLALETTATSEQIQGFVTNVLQAIDSKFALQDRLE